MIKQDEIKFKEAINKCKDMLPSSDLVQQIANGIGMHSKRASYILEKMTNNGEWNYGVSLFSGWVESK